LSNLTQLCIEQGEYVKALSCGDESLALFRELEHNSGITSTLLYLAKTRFASQDSTAAVDATLEECLTLTSKWGGYSSMAEAHHLLAQIALCQGDVTRARSLIEENLVFYRAIGYRAGLAESLGVLGQIAAVEGDAATAQAFYEESLVIARETGYNRVIPFSLEGLAAVVAAE